MDNERILRKGGYVINQKFEDLLQIANTRLAGIDQLISVDYKDRLSSPLIFICFAPRTGSTILSQYLALSGEFTYISNFVARFWKAPCFAFMLENHLKLSVNYHSYENKLKSDYGRTDEFYFPHEFGFFWNQLLTDETHFIDKSKLDSSCLESVVNTISQLRLISPKPFFIKNGIASYNAGLMRDLFPDAFFLILNRKKESISESIIRGRKALYNDENIWFSLKPKNYRKILVDYPNNPKMQIDIQIESIYKNINKGLADCKNVISVSYEDFCEAPQTVFNKIFDLIKWRPGTSEWMKRIPSSVERPV